MGNKQGTRRHNVANASENSNAILKESHQTSRVTVGSDAQFKDVPIEIILTILSFSSFTELCRYQQLSKFMQKNIEPYLYNSIKSDVFQSTSLLITEEQQEEAIDIKRRCLGDGIKGRAFYSTDSIDDFKSANFYAELSGKEKRCWEVLSKNSFGLMYSCSRRTCLSDMPPTTLYSYQYVIECKDGSWFQLDKHFKKRATFNAFSITINDISNTVDTEVNEEDVIQ